MPHGYDAKISSSGPLTETYTQPSLTDIDAMLNRFDRDVSVIHHLVFNDDDSPPDYSIEEEKMAHELLDAVDLPFNASDVVLSLYYFVPEFARSKTVQALGAAYRLSNAVKKKRFIEYINKEEGYSLPLFPGLSAEEIEFAEAYENSAGDSTNKIDVHHAARFVYKIFELQAEAIK